MNWQLTIDDVLAAPVVNVRAEILRLRAENRPWADIARSLNARAIPTPSGTGSWHAATVVHYAEPAAWAGYQRRYRARKTAA